MIMPTDNVRNNYFEMIEAFNSLALKENKLQSNNYLDLKITTNYNSYQESFLTHDNVSVKVYGNKEFPSQIGMIYFDQFSERQSIKLIISKLFQAEIDFEMDMINSIANTPQMDFVKGNNYPILSINNNKKVGLLALYAKNSNEAYLISLWTRTDFVALHVNANKLNLIKGEKIWLF